MIWPFICRMPLLIRPWLSRLVARPTANVATAFRPATCRAPQQSLTILGRSLLWGCGWGFLLGITLARRSLLRSSLLIRRGQSFALSLPLPFSRVFLALCLSFTLGCRNLSLCLGAQLLLRERIHANIIILQLLQGFMDRRMASRVSSCVRDSGSRSFSRDCLPCEGTEGELQVVLAGLSANSMLMGWVSTCMRANIMQATSA